MPNCKSSKTIILSFLAMLLMSLYAPIDSAAQEMKNKDVEKHFEELIFGTSNKNSGIKPRMVHKWQNNWKVFFKGEEDFAFPVVKKLSKLGEYTGLTYEPVTLEN